MFLNNLGLRQNFGGNNAGEMRMATLQKFCEAIEVGQGGSRPFELHRSRHGLNAGVPQV